MPEFQQLFVFLLGFGVVALAASNVGKYCARFRLPLITGFLLTGIVAGPFVLDLIGQSAVGRLGFINNIALAVIAFAAGSELFLKDFRTRLRSIAWVTASLTVATFLVGTASRFCLASFLPFLKDMSPLAKLVERLRCQKHSIRRGVEPHTRFDIGATHSQNLYKGRDRNAVLKNWIDSTRDGCKRQVVLS